MTMKAILLPETRPLSPAKTIMLKMTRNRHFLFGIMTTWKSLFVKLLSMN